MQNKMYILTSSAHFFDFYYEKTRCPELKGFRDNNQMFT